MKDKIVRVSVIIVVLLILLDQVSKILITKFVAEPIGNDFVGIQIVNNTGMALGFNEGNGKNIFLTIFVLGIVMVFMKNQSEQIDNKTRLSLLFVIAGGISNLIDRIFRGAVLDFIKIYKLPVFNIADFYVVLGWVLLVVFLIIYSRKK